LELDLPLDLEDRSQVLEQVLVQEVQGQGQVLGPEVLERGL
jgi:hypothetical protein